MGDKPLVISLPAPVSDHSGWMAEPCSREGFSEVWAPVLQASSVCRRGRKIFFFVVWFGILFPFILSCMLACSL